jgi:hypothetical protein
VKAAHSIHNRTHKKTCDQCRIAWNEYARPINARSKRRHPKPGSYWFAANVRWREKHRDEYLLAKRKQRLANYGLTMERFEAMRIAQNNQCACCKTTFAPTLPSSGNAPFNRAVVDHDHVTGAVRALLCAHCNRGLGLFKEDPQKLQAAIEYLARMKSVGGMK